MRNSSSPGWRRSSWPGAESKNTRQKKKTKTMKEKKDEEAEAEAENENEDDWLAPEPDRPAG